MVIKPFELSDVQVVFPNDATAVITYRVKQALASKGKGKGKRWQCVMHAETPAEAEPAMH